MKKQRLTESLKTAALELGFNRVGVCPAVQPPGLSRLDEWLAAGFAGQMQFFADRAAAYRHPQEVLMGARSVLMVALDYRTQPSNPASPGQGRIARYAWGDVDYHDLIHPKLKQLAAVLREHVPTALVRGVVDTAPLLEHEFAQLAGLGWIGKNTLLLNRRAGSYFFLAALLTDQELAYDVPAATDHCGTCTACLDACPTQAFPQPYVLDARQCISYLTIELRQEIPLALREPVGDWIFGCDVCQEVCPWNRFAPESCHPEFQPLANRNPIDLPELFTLSDEQFRTRFRHTPLWRSKRRGLLRNAAIVLGNRPLPSAVPSLVRGLSDEEPLVRGAAAWALGRYDSAPARRALADREAVETDPCVRREIEAALSISGPA